MNTQTFRTYLMVIACLLNGTGLFAQTNFADTFVICQGESVFLPALQQFPQPAQGPQGTSPCRPQVSDIGISPTENALKEDRRGYTVSPQITTIYEVESRPTCGPPGFGGTVGTAPGSSFVTYRVIVDNSCQAEEMPPVFEEFPWLTNFVNPNSCSNEKVERYQLGIYAYLLVTNASGQSTLYNQDGVFYCQNSANYDCVAAYNLGQAIATWQCGGTATTCDIYSNIPKDTDLCGACYKDISIYEFRGDKYIVYRAQTAGCRAIEIQVSSCGTGTFGCVTGPAIGFNPQCPIFFGEATLVETLWTDEACQVMEEPVVIRTAACIGERFEFPFPSDCNGRQMQIPTTNDIIQQISVNGATRKVNAVLKNYGSFERTHLVPNGAGDCVEVKHIYEMVEKEDCGMEEELPSIFEDYPWLSDIVTPNNCSNERIEVYQSGIYTYVMVRTVGAQGTLYNQDGLVYCQQTANYDCIAAYNLEQRIDIWACNTGVACPAVYDPVCGVDGNTYGNACEAGLAGVQIASEGECPNVQPEAPDELFFDYPWLTDIINPNACTNEKITVYQSGIYFYLLVTNASGQATLYNQDGLFYCQQSANYDCVAAYNLGQPIDTWACNTGIGCPAVVMPACGVDGNTYDINPCVQSNGDIEIAYLGICDPGPVICDMFSGSVVENECGTFILVGTQYWRPIFLDGVTVPSARDIVAFAFFPRNPSDYPDDGCLTSPNGTPPIVGVVSCLNITSQINIEETITICPGQSTFLAARQEREFGFGSGSTCLVSVEDIGIYPATDAIKDGINGYTVTPTQSTVYAVESKTFCKAVGPIGPSGIPPSPPISIRYYQVIVDECAPPTSADFYPEDCSAVTRPSRGTGIIVENACGTSIDFEDGQEFQEAVVKAHFTSCDIDFNEPVGTRVEFEYIPVPINLDCGGFEIVVINISIIENNDCNQYTGTYFRDICNNEFIQTTRPDGSAVLISPIFTVGDVPSIGAMIQFNTSNEGPGTAFCEGRAISMISAIIECVDLLDNAKCATTGTIFFRNCDNGQQYYFIETSDGRIYDPYFNDATLYTPVEGQRVNFDFVDANFSSPCSLADKAINITCIEAAQNNPTVGGNCANNSGEIFFEKCDDGTQFFFIRTTTGSILDAYFAEGITFVKYHGQKVRFDYVPASFNSPCSIADQVVIVTCIEEDNSTNSTSSIFLEYPWLSQKVDPNNCNGARIEVYQSGAYQYIFIETNGSGTLYFQDGSFYCMDGSNYDCRAAYRLSNPIDTWTCTGNLQETAEERTQEIVRLEGFVAYPNPTLGRLRIQLPILLNPAQLRISNLFGQQVLEKTIAPTSAEQTMTLDLTAYQNGIYYLELRTSGRRGIQKIIKQDMQ